MRELLKDGVRAEDIVILSQRKLSSSGLEGSSPGGLTIRDLCSDEAPAHGDRQIDFCTMHAFKGLERRAVIAWNMAELETPDLERLHYCGLSRARSLLMILLPERERNAVKRQFERNSAVVVRALAQQPTRA
ncbi:nuclease [Cystobacter fuscus]|uniref:Nuclease n=1 Tax=Cystobacter fuscus TaxID=43 RepID=A0A250J2Z5_9BACT|nr:ATP-binding domain-containing protein [Cystobacter fuscus]ATB37943.1 nuclease [Cystobacter fuscus]